MEHTESELKQEIRDTLFFSFLKQLLVKVEARNTESTAHLIYDYVKDWYCSNDDKHYR